MPTESEIAAILKNYPSLDLHAGIIIAADGSAKINKILDCFKKQSKLKKTTMKYFQVIYGREKDWEEAFEFLKVKNGLARFSTKLRVFWRIVLRHSCR